MIPGCCCEAEDENWLADGAPLIEQVLTSAPLQKGRPLAPSPNVFTSVDCVATSGCRGMMRLRSNSCCAATPSPFQNRNEDFRLGITGISKFHTVTVMPPPVEPCELVTV